MTSILLNIRVSIVLKVVAKCFNFDKLVKSRIR